MTRRGTVIRFGGGDQIEVAARLGKTRRLFQAAMSKRRLLEVKDVGGGTIVVNPGQMVMLTKTAKGEG